ncbi:bifunctional nucleoside/nucleotide kinase/histidine phosphatase family protein [Polyangium aurulentum]|uniref:bifunctional nucleoside/nucleotide kinase/histidine phosphatase family protein n=1 Tax=Polyangium aurulentum TaxID=2567896 RepID=UPI001F27255B|nr:6-phosphofructo-2-kinase/fructose-2,6-bisphosphatase [Polyangium aurulentum]
MPHERDRATNVLAMVGLPARGKTYIARRLARYLNWLGHSTRVFNVGSYRRRQLGASQPADFFSPANATGRAVLNELAMNALDDMIDWLQDGGEVGIFDATNSTKERRKVVEERTRKAGVPLVFIESLCNDASVVEANVRETKLSSPDYTDMDPEAATRDFLQRIAHYESMYETLDDPGQSYIKIIDVGRQVTLNRIHGYLPARLAPLLIDMHVSPRPIWLTRHGQSMYNVHGRIGGDPELSPAGEEYARNLAQFVRQHASRDAEVGVWTSTMTRTIQTATHLTRSPRAWRALDEIDAGVCDGMTYDQMRIELPDVWSARQADKFRYRYPRGESYEDVIQRLDPVIIQLERQRSPILVIAHQAVLRAIYAYLMALPPSDCPSLSIPLHTVIQLTPTAYGCEEKRFALPPNVEDQGAGG